MDNENMKQACSLLCLDVPSGTEFGIDYQEWVCGEKFKGIKLIPPGVHFVFYSPKSKQGGEGAPRTGFFLNFSSGEVIVKKWNPQIEDFFDDNELDKDELERYAEGVKRFEFDQYLGAYQMENYSQWISLSSLISKNVLSQLEPIGKKISSLYDTGDAGKTEDKDPYSKYRPYYSSIPRKQQPFKGASVAEITRYNFEKTEILLQLFKRYEHPNDLLGELQFAFICFLMGQSYDGFEHWKQLVEVLCLSDRALHEYPQFFCTFIGVFRYQLEQIPQDFFVDIVSGENFLITLLKGFFELLEDENLDASLVSAANDFKKFVEKKFGRSFSIVNLEEDEDAPVIVET